MVDRPEIRVSALYRFILERSFYIAIAVGIGFFLFSLYVIATGEGSLKERIDRLGSGT
jgi:hypothetical protein